MRPVLTTALQVCLVGVAWFGPGCKTQDEAAGAKNITGSPATTNPGACELQITKLDVKVGPDFFTNCYVVSDPRANEALVIDPGAEPERVSIHLQSRELIRPWLSQSVLTDRVGGGETDRVGGGERDRVSGGQRDRQVAAKEIGSVAAKEINGDAGGLSRVAQLETPNRRRSSKKR